MFSRATEIAQSLYCFVGLIAKHAKVVSVVSDDKLKSDCKCIVIRRRLLSYRNENIPRDSEIIIYIPRDGLRRYLHPCLHRNTDSACARRSLGFDPHE